MTHIAELFGIPIASLTDEGFPQELHAGYKDILSQDGIVFMTPEQRHAHILWSAHAARARGEYALNADGSQVDLSSYDEEATGQIIRGAREAHENDRKLDSLTEMGVISRAGSLVLARVSDIRGLTHSTTDTAGTIVNYFKRFVQAGMEVEQWEHPWRDLVHYGFAGEGLSLPLDAQGIVFAHGVLRERAFQNVRDRHFASLFHIAHNLGNAIDYATEGRLDTEQQGLLTTAGMFYKSSPAGSEELVQIAISQDALPAFNWKRVIEQAVDELPQYRPLG